MDNSFDSTINATNNNLSKLSKAVSSTAHSLMSSQYGDLSNNAHFQSAMSDIALSRRPPVFQKRMFSFASKKSPTAVVKSSLSKNEIQYQAVTMIPDELLRDIPVATSNKFSLFQGFKAIEEDFEPKPKPIAATANRKTLAKDKRYLNHRLDLLEIRKDLAANEIKEIDDRIEYLKSMREIVFNRVALLEQEELQLEHELRVLSMKLEDFSDGEEEEHKKQDKKDKLEKKHMKEDKSNGKVSPTDEPDSTEPPQSQTPDSDPEYSLLSKSIYGKLQESVNTRPKTTSSIGTSYPKSSGRRRTMPTLQQYYTPGQEIRTMSHSESIVALDFDIPFGTMACAGVEDSSIVLWDLSRGEKLSCLIGHNASVKCLQMSDNLIVSGAMDATAKLWNIENEDQPLVESFESHIDEITALHFFDTTLVTGSADRTIRQWDMNKGRCLQTLDVLWAAAQNPGGLSEDVRLRRQKMAGSNANDFVGALQCFDAALASGTADGIVRLWDLRSGQVHRSLIGHTGPISCLQFDDVHLTTGSLDRSIRIWDLRMGSLYDAFAYEKPVTSLQFDSRRIVSSNCENTVKIYDRILEKHWSCGAGEEDDNAAIVNTVRYREGYLIEGREDGKIGVWAV